LTLFAGGLDIIVEDDDHCCWEDPYPEDDSILFCLLGELCSFICLDREVMNQFVSRYQCQVKCKQQQADFTVSLVSHVDRFYEHVVLALKLQKDYFSY
jgi:hypothetical protein